MTARQATESPVRASPLTDEARDLIDAGDKLAIGEPRRRLAADPAGAPVVLVRLADAVLQGFAHGTGTEDDQLIVRRQPSRDLFEESLEILEAVRLTGGLRPAAAVADVGVVPDMAGGPVTSRHLQRHPLESSPIVLPADDDGRPPVHEATGRRSARPGWPMKT